MADQHHEAAPALGNAIAADVPDILESIKYHWDLLQMLLGLPDTTTIGNASPPGFQRSRFTHVDDDTITIGTGVYFHDGTTRQTVFWDTAITFDFGSGGSNSGSDDIDAGAADIHYIYLDDSAIVTQASPELDADCFLNSKTAPSWSAAKHGWYNGNDRCIFAVLTDASNDLLEFWHDGGELVVLTTQIAIFGTDVANDWSDNVDFSTYLPAFSTKPLVVFESNAQADTTLARMLWRTDGSSGDGLVIGYIQSGETELSISVTPVITSAAGVIEVKCTDTGAQELSAEMQGWYFPTGM